MQQVHIQEIEENFNDTNFVSSLLEGGDCELQVCYPSEFPNAKILRELVDLIAKNFGVSPKWRTRLVLIVDELNNNAIEYGSALWDTNILSVSMKHEEDNFLEVNISTQDSGTGAKTKSAADMEKMREESEWKNFSEHHSIRWRGLFLIISHLVDELYFKDAEDKGLIVGFQKKLDLSEA